MMSRNRFAAAMAIVLALLLVGGAAVVVRQAFFRPKVITAYFTTATAIYPGDEVRVSGVKVGSIVSIRPQGTQAKMTMNVDRAVPIPADAKAVIVAQNVLAARYVQLTPTYRSSGPTMGDGAVIPIQRTAVPVEWDEVKEQLSRVAAELGPSSQVSTPSVARFIDSAADALNGNGDKLRQTLAQLAGVGRILADGSGNIVDIIKNLQTFVAALRDSSTQVVQFQDRFATLTSVLDDSRSDLDAALTNVSSAVTEVQRFIAETRDKTSDELARLADVTQNLAEHRKDLEQVLHIAPNGLANTLGAYNPNTGTLVGQFVLSNFSNPVQLFCSSIGAIENVTAIETGKLCSQYLGPALRQFNFNYSPIPFKPFLGPSPTNLIYTDPDLAPGGVGPPPGPPEQQPAVSAYTGRNGDVPPPLGWAGAGLPPMAPGLYTQPPMPAFPTPAWFPGAPNPTAPLVVPPGDLPGLLLPALPAEGTPPS
ncbi:MCE family protein [Mycobacterium sp. 663a-19]|uniref:MCE family protein n=1 Tax=Mycobacterium sp. 663a-19 TaxID=2986148 RepID=UPI002D1F156E|nr:MCE family protein [Mycobacterium sp. 663a-19]MEB3980057.1 MCE family protein [Mycobacterium sp. 663a-19]